MSFIPYFGGKTRLVATLVALLPMHHTYVEVFGGGARLLFGKTPSNVEVLNDLNSELTTLYRVVQYHNEEFVRCLQHMLPSRDEFDRLKRSDPSTLTDIQRAVRHYYLLRTSYAAKIDSPTFNAVPSKPSGFNPQQVAKDLEAVRRRLARVYIENRSYERLIPQYDRPETFFYLDPPYVGYEGVYGPGLFGQGDFERLRDILRGIAGKFLMSLNNVDLIRRLFGEFNIREVPVRYSTGARKVGRELLIANYQIGEAGNDLLEQADPAT